jgi:hypothetical protein
MVVNKNKTRKANIVRLIAKAPFDFLFSENTLSEAMKYDRGLQAERQ